MNIYIGNLAYSVTEKELIDAFSKFGEVTSANVVKDKYSGQSKGFAFVEMANKTDGAKAIAELNGTSLKERQITVNEAKPRENRDHRKNNKGGGGFKRY